VTVPEVDGGAFNTEERRSMGLCARQHYYTLCDAHPGATLVVYRGHMHTKCIAGTYTQCSPGTCTQSSISQVPMHTSRQMRQHSGQGTSAGNQMAACNRFKCLRLMQQEGTIVTRRTCKVSCHTKPAVSLAQPRAERGVSTAVALTADVFFCLQQAKKTTTSELAVG
jgi:hypothetical protein